MKTSRILTAALLIAGPMAALLFADDTPPNMVFIPGGTNSGTNSLGPGEAYSPWYPATYSLTVESFAMDQCEVTKAKWTAVRAWGLTNGYTDLAEGDGKATNHPVCGNGLTWFDCLKWCNARSEMEGRTPAYYTSAAKTNVYKIGRTNLTDDCVNWSSGYRLPTSDEWEYAARGGVSSKRFPWGQDTISHSQANYTASHWSDYDLSTGGDPVYAKGASPYTSPAGAFAAATNAWGLQDMAGNVWEWCWSWQPGFDGWCRVNRGGCWSGDAGLCRIGYRTVVDPEYNDWRLGFRAVLPMAGMTAKQTETEAKQKDDVAAPSSTGVCTKLEDKEHEQAGNDACGVRARNRQPSELGR